MINAALKILDNRKARIRKIDLKARSVREGTLRIEFTVTFEYFSNEIL